MQQLIHPSGQKDISSHIIKLAANIILPYLPFLVIVILILHLGHRDESKLKISIQGIFSSLRFMRRMHVLRRNQDNLQKVPNLYNKYTRIS
jgi:Flp pilus assembly protein TadB